MNTPGAITTDADIDRLRLLALLARLGEYP